jgi:hypothetical protein
MFDPHQIDYIVGMFYLGLGFSGLCLGAWLCLRIFGDL